ncbi:MAG: SurA N-terminal domain-containing protein [Candidatus Omnitrophica bacterium]|jgi:peptidyl-prolyl cis-trans isomerase D|nr:SurA N-terminal domain-containing protein [Candidatus Omnitrophota bacterium]
MLKFLRDRKNSKKIWIFLAIVIVIPFAFWGAGSVVSDKNYAGYVGTICGRKITSSQFQDSYNATAARLRLQFPDQFDQLKDSLDLESQAWERLVLISEAKRRNIKVTDQEVIKDITANPTFQGKNGFDDSAYKHIIKYYLHSSPRAFEEQTRESLMLAKLYDQVTCVVKLDDEQLKEEYRKANEELSISYISAQYAELEKNIQADDETLKSYFQNNSIKFKEPLSFNLEYVKIEAEEKTSLKQRSEKIFLLAQKNIPLKKIAQENKLTLKETGLFPETGPIPEIGWAKQIINALPKIKPDEYLPPYCNQQACFLAKIKVKMDPYIPEFTTIKDKIKIIFSREKAKEQAKERIEKCLARLKEQPDSDIFETTAVENGLKYASTSFFKFASYIEGIGSSSEFWLTAEKLQPNKASEIISTPTALFIIRLKEKKEADWNKFEEDKKTFSEKILSDKKNEYFTSFLKELDKKAFFKTSQS